MSPHWGGGGAGYSPSIYPSNFSPPSVPSGWTLQVFEDFNEGSFGYDAGSGVNAEGAVWLPSHVTQSGSIANINAWQDTSALGQYGITSGNMAANGNWVTGQFGLNPTPSIGTASGTRILFAMRADSMPGLTALGLTTAISSWPPEIDIVEINAPMTLNAATLHYGSAPPNPPGFYPYTQVACDVTQWAIWGLQWNASTISLLTQTTPTGALTAWWTLTNPDPTGTHSFAQAQYLAFQYQTQDAIYDSGTPNYPANHPEITGSNPVQQQIDWVQICTINN